MKAENGHKKMTNYFAVLRGVKLPWITILCSFAFSVLMMRAELQVATMTSDIIDSSQKAINASKLISYISAVRGYPIRLYAAPCNPSWYGNAGSCP